MRTGWFGCGLRRLRAGVRRAGTCAAESGACASAARIRRDRRGPRGDALRGRAGRPEALRQVCRALRRELRPSQYLHRARARHSRAQGSDRSAHRFLRPRSSTTRIGFGLRMLHGAQLAVEEANARGGYGGKPFKLMLHNDYNNWQAKAVYGDDRPTDPTIWGSASNEAVKMVYDDQDWAIFGSISSESTHIALRVALRAEIPIVNSARPIPRFRRPTFPGTSRICRTIACKPDAGAPHLYRAWPEARGAAQVNNRYGRFGVPSFAMLAAAGPSGGDRAEISARRHGFFAQLRSSADSRADAIVLVGG
jgi:hypothetical protein